MKKIISALLILTMVFSMVCVSASAAGVHINMNFESMEAFTSRFIAGAFYVEDNLLFGYAEAKALQSNYNSDPSWGEPWFQDGPNTWMTYDATITFALGDDELSDTGRFVNLVYCNDNLLYYGREEGRVFMSFFYDVEGRAFHFANGFNNTEPADQYMEPVAMEMPTEDGAEFVTLGISVAKDNIRCFYNDQLIFNYTNPDTLVAHDITSPFLFWQDGNFIQIKNITVADQGYLFPANVPGPVVTGNQETTTKATSETTTRIENVEVTDDKGNAVTDDKGNKVTEQVIITEPPVADTNTGAVQGGNSTSTGDTAFIVVAAMVAALGCALIVKKVNA